ncbi:hypothetical protein ACGFNP_31605 [Nonomuraea sp. NPDC049269]|uniref:hypothetical protein n=1 Tax=Nonomuraea sp. NPDC049269 TaxID=3364349 RepID=UPI0037190635
MIPMAYGRLWWQLDSSPRGGHGYAGAVVVPEPGGARGPVRSSGETVATDVAA